MLQIQHNWIVSFFSMSQLTPIRERRLEVILENDLKVDGFYFPKLCMVVKQKLSWKIFLHFLWTCICCEIIQSTSYWVLLYFQSPFFPVFAMNLRLWLPLSAGGFILNSVVHPTEKLLAVGKFVNEKPSETFHLRSSIRRLVFYFLMISIRKKNKLVSAGLDF